MQGAETRPRKSREMPVYHATDAISQQEFFATLDARNRYSVLFRTQGAKKAETRARRIAQFVEMLAKGEKIYP